MTYTEQYAKMIVLQYIEGTRKYDLLVYQNFLVFCKTVVKSRVLIKKDIGDETL